MDSKNPTQTVKAKDLIFIEDKFPGESKKEKHTSKNSNSRVANWYYEETISPDATQQEEQNLQQNSASEGAKSSRFDDSDLDSTNDVHPNP